MQPTVFFMPLHVSFPLLTLCLLVLVILILHLAGGGVGNSSSSSYTPSSAHVISSHSPSFILASSYFHHADGGVTYHVFFFLHTTLHMYHFISSSQFPITCPFIHTKLPAAILLDLCVFQWLITTLSFPFSLHMPLITKFSSGPWLSWSLITAFSLVWWIGRQFGRKKSCWGNKYVIQASELHGC